MHRESGSCWLLARRHAWIGAMGGLLVAGDPREPTTSAHCRFLLSGQTATLRGGPGALGAGPDLVARSVGQKVSDSHGQSVVVNTRTGAVGSIRAGIVVKSPPDGYTVLIVCEQPL